MKRRNVLYVVGALFFMFGAGVESMIHQHYDKATFYMTLACMSLLLELRDKVILQGPHDAPR